MTVYDVLNEVDKQLRKCGKSSRRLLIKKLRWLLDQYEVEDEYDNK